MKSTEQHTNNLIHETSPYLLQHAHNPVDWRAWNDKSLALAKKENKLIVISVGYSACHWCHVMEEESFENDSIAKIMNENFINIKVDREERPDVDQVYMNAVQLITGRGGWPLNVIALPDGRPVFGGTYFTKPQWMQVLNEMSDLYKKNPEKVIAYAEELTAGIQNSELIAVNTEDTDFKPEHLDDMLTPWMTNLDHNKGGRTGAPKFPMPTNLSFLMRVAFQNKDKTLNDYVMTTLTKMALGGIYDQVGGGFSRYSVDEKWHIPHFEKMLYDNAQLVSLYADAYSLSKNELYKATVIETIDFIERELTDENGAYYSSLDADSTDENGNLEEGAYYSWTVEELKQLLGKDLELFKDYYNVNSFGKWEKKQYVLIRKDSDEEFAKQNNITPQDLSAKISQWKLKLLEARAKRERPRTDDKILTSWNALMLKAYVDAYRVFGKPEYLQRAVKNANFIKAKQLRKDGGLYHNFKDGKSTIEGFSEDYAAVISAYIALYEVSLDESWLNNAKNLMDYAIVHFSDTRNGMFYFTSDNETKLITKKMEVIDNVIPASNSLLANDLFKLSHYFGDSKYSKRAKQMLNNIIVDAEQSPSGYANWLNLYLNYSNPYYEVAVSGAQAKEKIASITNHYIPNILLAGATNESNMPLMENRFNEDDTYIYVCVDSACKLPEKDVEKALSQLEFN